MSWRSDGEDSCSGNGWKLKSGGHWKAVLSTMRCFRSVRVEERAPDSLAAAPPAPLLRTLIETDSFSQLSERLAGLAGALGAEISLSDGSDVDAATHEVAAAVDSPPAALPAEPVGVSINTAVIAVGKRSRDIIRHVGRSLKAPTEAVRSVQDDDWLIVSGARGRDRILDRSGLSTSTIMLLFDEDDPDWTGSGRLDRHLRDQADAGALVILVPALPVRHPSRILDRRWSLFGSSWRGTVTQSWTPPSPAHRFGGEGRNDPSIVASQTQSQLAAAACRSHELREELRARPVDGSLPIVAIGLVPKDGRGRRYDDRSGAIWLGSEATWVSGDPWRGDPAILFSLRINPGDVGLRDVENHVLAEGRRKMRRFADFAGAVVAHVLAGRGREAGMPSFRVSEGPAIPDTIARRLTFPPARADFSSPRLCPRCH